MSKTTKHTEEKPQPLPSKECIECKLYRAFVTCFGITAEDMKRSDAFAMPRLRVS